MTQNVCHPVLFSSAIWPPPLFKLKYGDGFTQVYPAVMIFDLEVTADLGATPIAIGAKNLTGEMPEKNLPTSRKNEGAFVCLGFESPGATSK